MSIFLSGGGGGCEAGLAVRESGWGGLCGAMDMGLCSLFFILGLLERIFLLLILSFWFILKKKENFLFGAGFQDAIFLSFPSFLKIVSILFWPCSLPPPFYAILRAFYAKKFSQYMLIFLFVSMGHFSPYKHGHFRI